LNVFAVVACSTPQGSGRVPGFRAFQVLADGLSGYLDGVQERLQTAERERAVAVARAEEEVKTRQVAEEKATEQRKRRRVQAQLAAAVAALVLGGISVAWWQTAQANARRETDLRRQLADEQRAAADAARLARNGEAVSSLLAQCEGALKADDAARAGVALDAGRKRFAEGGAAEQAKRLGRLEADLALSRDLNAVDQFRMTPVERKLPDAADVALRTREALARFGADPYAVAPDDVATRVSASVVRERILFALDRLLLRVPLENLDRLPAEERKEITPRLRADVAALLPKTPAVRAVLRLVDADSFRDAVRDALVAEDRAKLVELAGQKAALEQPPWFVKFLGATKAIAVERRRQLLHSAVSRRSGDPGLLMTLGLTYTDAWNGHEGLDEPLRWFQAAVAAAPADIAAHYNLAETLYYKHQWDEAIACWRKAIELDPKDARTYTNLATVLGDNPDLAEAHLNVGELLAKQGRFAESLEVYKRGHELGSKQPAWPYPSAELVRQAEAKAATESKVLALLKGDFQPGDNNERLELVGVCLAKKLHHAAAGLYAAAFAADPKLADDVKAGHRYDAACFAALAAAGQGAPGKLDDKERTRLRKQALDWLRADLALRAQQLNTGKPADRTEFQRVMLHWQKDTDIASLRDAAPLAMFPAEEQNAFAQLWADVAALLQKTTGPPC
jgi:tetratricopeptide (TPR) repeat protein